MFARLLPKEGRFFDLFRANGELLVQTATEFRAMLDDLPNAQAYSRKIKDLEHQGDEITHSTKSLLHKTFITPLDREDIHSLISRLDDILDYLDAASQRVTLYGIAQVTPETFQLADICIRSCEHVRRAVQGLDNLKESQKIVQECVEVNRLENEADNVLRAGMAKLFRDEPDIRRLIMMKELYELLETVTDRCEDVANIVEGIVLEYA